jgi:hypothetical protein
VTIINYRREGSMSVANQVKCARASFHVMRKAAEELQGQYAVEIGQKLWNIASVSAAHLDWENSYACISLALNLNCKVPFGSNKVFQLACQVNPYFAAFTREYLIRAFKPDLRIHTR